MFSEPGPEPPGSYPDLEPPPTTSAFDGGTLGQLAHGTFEDPSGNAGVYGERSSGDTLALHAKDPDITPLYTEPIAAEPYEPAVVAEITDLETTEPGIQPERVTPEVETEPEDNELSELAAESEYVEPEPALDEVISGFDASESSLNEGEELDEVDEEVSTASEVLQPDDILTSYSEPERLGLASVVEEPRPDPDVIPIDTEPIAEEAHAEPGLDGSDYSGSIETSLFDPSGDPGDQVEGPKISGSASEIRDEEPLRSALLQSFKDVVARTPATPDDDGESESFGLEDASLPEEPERREVIPRKPPARPRRF